MLMRLRGRAWGPRGRGGVPGGAVLVATAATAAGGVVIPPGGALVIPTPGGAPATIPPDLSVDILAKQHSELLRCASLAKVFNFVRCDLAGGGGGGTWRCSHHGEHRRSPWRACTPTEMRNMEECNLWAKEWSSGDGWDTVVVLH